jgi:hypothetical protein
MLNDAPATGLSAKKVKRASSRTAYAACSSFLCKPLTLFVATTASTNIRRHPPTLDHANIASAARHIRD